MGLGVVRGGREGQEGRKLRVYLLQVQCWVKCPLLGHLHLKTKVLKIAVAFESLGKLRKCRPQTNTAAV